jgi:S-adenosylmethionine:tRNA ribosyltransferase-isomerase
MKLSQFKYNLPQELIATMPARERDESRLMVVNRKTKLIEHRVFKDVIDFFDEGDIFVMNDTKVFPAKLYGIKEKTAAKIEVFLLREINADARLWDVLVDPARKIRIGNKIYFGANNEIIGEVIDNTTSRGRTMRFLFDGTNDQFHTLIHKMGVTPLPNDVLDQRKVVLEDADRYQTLFAEHEGAVAAPTAGLHFSKILLKKMEVKGINTAMITLHNGLGNFRPIEVEDLTKHKSDSEEMFISEQAAATINAAKEEKRKIVAVGTTSMKAIETAVTINSKVKPFEGWTNKFIFPPYDFSIADAMITNFHPTLSPMLMMVCAFGGHDLIMDAYKEAIKEKYNFLTYGDAMLIL